MSDKRRDSLYSVCAVRECDVTGDGHPLLNELGHTVQQLLSQVGLITTIGMFMLPFDMVDGTRQLREWYGNIPCVCLLISALTPLNAWTVWTTTHWYLSHNCCSVLTGSVLNSIWYWLSLLPCIIFIVLPCTLTLWYLFQTLLFLDYSYHPKPLAERPPHGIAYFDYKFTPPSVAIAAPTVPIKLNTAFRLI